MWILLKAVLALFSGICYRLRGSGWFTDDSSITGLRVVKLATGALPVALAALMLGMPWWVILLVWLGTAAADSLPHGNFQGTSNIWQVLGMGGIGIAQALPITLAMYFTGSALILPIAALSIGACAGLAYLLGNIWPSHFAIGPVGFHKGPEMGEVFYGITRTLFLFF